MFKYDAEYWKPNLTKALLTSVPQVIINFALPN